MVGPPLSHVIFFSFLEEAASPAKFPGCNLVSSSGTKASTLTKSNDGQKWSQKVEAKPFWYSCCWKDRSSYPFSFAHFPIAGLWRVVPRAGRQKDHVSCVSCLLACLFFSRRYTMTCIFLRYSNKENASHVKYDMWRNRFSTVGSVRIS